MRHDRQIGDGVCVGNCADCLKRIDLGDAHISRTVRKSLEDNGFARFDMNDAPKHYGASLNAIRKVAAEMPMDRTDGGVGRARLYGRGHMMPWMPQGEDLYYEPGRVYAFNDEYGLEYSQPTSVNSVAAGKRRIFKPFSRDLYNNQLILDLTRMLWLSLPFDHDTKQSLMTIGMHLIKLSPSGEIPAVASPNLVHRDGEIFTAGILIDRINADGGFNSITHTRWHDHPYDDVPENDVYNEFTMENPLQGYIVQDDRVAHYVSPVASVDPDAHAERTILLIDFTPSRPDINLDGIE